jgi:hypothetical protein
MGENEIKELAKAIAEELKAHQGCQLTEEEQQAVRGPHKDQEERGQGRLVALWGRGALDTKGRLLLDRHAHHLGMEGRMSEHFERAVAFVLRHEGGYVNDPRDPGGETKYGISKRAYPRLDIKGLTEADAKEIYRRDYWEKAG